MEKVIDPVCGMSIDPATAAGKTSYEGRDYHFCSKACEDEFKRDPARYRHADTGVPRGADDPPYTKSGGMVSPKFGSAGSGGGEYEPLPGDKRDN